MTLEERVDNLETMVTSLVNKLNNTKFYTDASIESDNVRIIEASTDISDNRTAIEESYELGLENSTDLSDLRTAVEEVYELIEGGENNG